MNLLEKGLLPILLVAEKHSTSSSFILAKGKVFVLDEATGATSVSQLAKVTSQTAGDATAIAGASLLAGAPVMIAGLKMASDATVIKHNLADKERNDCSGTKQPSTQRNFQTGGSHRHTNKRTIAL